MARTILVLAASFALFATTACRADTTTGDGRVACTHCGHDDACRNDSGCLGQLVRWATYHPQCTHCKCCRLMPCCRPPLYYFFLCEGCCYHLPYGGHCSNCKRCNKQDCCGKHGGGQHNGCASGHCE